MRTWTEPRAHQVEPLLTERVEAAFPGLIDAIRGVVAAGRTAGAG